MANCATRISIGRYELSNRAFLAPMAGITDRSMRNIAGRFGAGMVVSEMIASASLATGHHEMVRKLSRSAGLPHVVQLAGCEAEWLTRGAKIAEEAGAQIIDINFGCPSKRVTNGYAGSALMRVPEVALGLVEAVVEATSLPVTVKMRLGWDDSTLNAPRIARDAQNAGVRMITVHARTRQQFYKESARWELVRAVKDSIDVPVVVNGDIISIEHARAALSLSGADAVMIGRGAQGRPWVVGQIGALLDGHPACQTPRGRVLLDLICEHYDSMLGEYGKELGARVARKHLGWYLDAIGCESGPQRKALMVAEDPSQIFAMLPDLVLSDWSKAA